MIAFERVISPKAKRVGSMFQKRLTCSNQTSETSAECWVFSTSSRRWVSKLRERGRDVARRRSAPERLVERDAVLHGELGAGADREMRGRLGVADQHDVAGSPALAADGRKIAPDRAVGDQAVALELLGEHALDEPRRGGLVELVEPGPREGRGSVSMIQVERPGSY